MNSLHAHLAAGDAHAHLPFHPECRMCRAERLAGVLPDPALFPHAVRAGVCAGILTVSTALATAGPLAVPAGADEVSAGAVAKPGDDGDDPKDDDDGNEEEVDGSGAEEVTVITGSTPPPPPPPPAAGPEPDAQSGQAPGVPAPAGDLAGAQPDPAQAPPPVQAPAASPDEPRKSDDKNRGESRKLERAPKRASMAPQLAVPAPQPTPVAPAPVAADPNPATKPLKGGETHVVQSGESLWSVAHAALGEGASPAQIARYVDRLWTLNADRIGTGDPSLIHVGERVALPLER